MGRDYSKIREMLEAQECFPIEYVHKVIGRNTAEFVASVERLEGRFSTLRRSAEKPSASNAHLSITLVLAAGNVDEVIALLEATEELDDLVMVL